MLRLKFIHRTICTLLLLLPVLAFAVDNEPVSIPDAPTDIVPDSNKQAFRKDSRKFWLDEMPSILGRYFPHGWVFAGGIHGLSGTCTSPAFATEAFTAPTTPDGRADRVRANSNGTGGTATINYAATGANCGNPGADRVRVAACSVVGNTVGNWNRSVGSNYFVNPVDETFPIPAGCAVLMRTTITNGAITAVQNISDNGPVYSGFSKNVKECGAQVDGVTDDTVALNACLAAFPSVLIPRGTLKHSGTILINVGNHLEGVAPDLWDPLGIDSPEARVPGSELLYTGVGDAISSIYLNVSVCQCAIENLMIRAPSGAIGIHLKNTADVLIRNNLITGQPSIVPATGLTTAGVFLEGGGGGIDNANIAVRIEGNYFVYGVGTAILASNVNNINGIHVTGNDIIGWTRGILTQSRTRGWHVAGNIVEGCGMEQIKIQEKGEAWEIVANYFEAPLGSIYTSLVWLRMCAGCDVRANVFQGTGAANMLSGLYLGDSANGFIPQGLTIESNHFNGITNGIYLNAGYGITIRRNVRGTDITREFGGSRLNVQQIDYESGTILNDASPGVTPIETLPVIQSAQSLVTSFFNTVAEVTLYTATIPGYSLQSGANPSPIGGIHIDVSGSIIQNTGANRDILIRVTYGGVIIAQHNWLAIVSGGARAWMLDGVLTDSPAFGPNRMLCRFATDLGPAGSASGDPSSAVVNSVSLRYLSECNASSHATVDMTADQQLVITATMSFADVNFQVAFERAYIERLPY